MSEGGAMTALFRRQLSGRERMIVFITLLTVAGALVYQFPYLMLSRSVRTISAKVVAAEKDIAALSARITDIRAHEAEIRAGIQSGINSRDLVDRRGVILFLDDISSEARRQGVSLIAVHPAQEIEKEKYREVSMNLDLKGRYRELAEYFRQLEQLSRIVNIRKVRVEACPDSSSACATQLEAVTYMEK